MKNKKTISILIAVVLTLTCSSSFAITRLGKYSLVVNKQPIALSSEAGYLYKQGTAIMIPIQTVSKNLGCPTVLTKKTNLLTITCPDEKQITIRAGSKFAVVAGKKYALRAKTIAPSSGPMLCDVRVVTYMQSGFKHYKPALAKPAGYQSGALVISSEGDLSLPYMDPNEALPPALREAAKQTRQIVGVEQISGSQAKLTLYEKPNNLWVAHYSTVAYIGIEGLGKTEEGDEKTPTGTYNLTQPFGILADPGSKMGYTKINSYHYWCSNSSSKYYNRLIDIRNVDYTPIDKDERLINYRPVYNYAFFIDYNAQGQPYKGSAIFLHCMGQSKSTSGCVAVPEKVMVDLLKTLGDGAKIVIY